MSIRPKELAPFAASASTEDASVTSAGSYGACRDAAREQVCGLTLGFCPIDIGHYNFCPFEAQPVANCGADATSRAGDQRHLSGKSEIHNYCSLRRRAD
jgi:hypothetical protein